ncbi:MAG: mechanosensitive ion channel [Spirochaetales bacterium]|nr:mechanosensitive ion channel [Spirochaetales bacterium]
MFFDIDMEKINAVEKQIILLDDIEELFLKNIDGYGVLKDLFLLVSRTQSRILWIATANSIFLSFIKKIFPVTFVFQFFIDLTDLTPQRLAAIFEAYTACRNFTVKIIPDKEIAKQIKKKVKAKTISTRPFTIGDKIKVKDYYGEVVDINLLKVRIRTPDDSLVTVPCKTILEDTVSDANSGELNCQVVTEMYLPGNSDLLEIKRIAYEAVYSSPYSYLQKPVVILFQDVYTETALLKMKIKAYVADHRYEFVFSSDICERIKHYFMEHKIIPPDFYRLPYFSSHNFIKK